MVLPFLAAVLSGVLLVAAFPRYDQSFLLFVGLIPLLWALRGRSGKTAFWLGLVQGVAFYLGLLAWIFHVTYVHGKLPFPLALGVLLLLALHLSWVRGLWALGVAWAERRGISLLWFAPTLWVVMEYIQGYPVSSFPWELMGHGLYRHPLLLQAADLIGAPGLSFLVVLVNVGLLGLLSPPPRRSRKGAAALLAVVLAVWLGYGHYKLGVMAEVISRSPRITTAVIQGNIQQSDKWDPKMVQATLETYARLTRQTLEKAKRPEPGEQTPLVIWPETAAPFFFQIYPGRDTPFETLVRRVAQENQAYLLFGAPALEQRPTGEVYFNRAYLLNPQGEVAGFYDKAHLVPWGEYVPLQRVFFFIQKMVPMIGDFAEGPVGATVALPQGRVGVLICYESIFGYLSRAQVQNGAHLLVNITNDAWFGRTSAPYQHMSMAVLRAVENRVSLARAANTGISAFVSGDGRLLWASPLEEEAGMVLELPWLPGGSFYLRYGHFFPWVCIVIVALAFVVWRRSRLLPR